MNASRLRSIVAFMLGLEKKHNIQGLLATLLNSLNNLASAPNQPQHQTDVATNLDGLEKALTALSNGTTPAQKKNIADVKGYPHFSNSIIDEIRRSISQNAMTPSVTRDLVQRIINTRQTYINILEALPSNFAQVGVELQTLKPGEAEAGILLPRELFNNNLADFQKELRILNQILRTFYEVANVPMDKIEIKEISTTDPILFLGMDITALVHFGHALRWCNDTLKAIRELKDFIATAKNLDIDQKKLAVFDSEISERVKKSIDNEVEAILAHYNGPGTRKAELNNSLHIALDQLLQRVERGVTVEIKLIPPPAPNKDSPKPDQDAATSQAFAEVAAIAKELEFPPIQGQPALQLTSVEVDQSPPQKKKSPS